MNTAPTFQDRAGSRSPAIVVGLLALALLLLALSAAAGPVIGFLRALHSGVDYHSDSTHHLFLGGHQSIICARNTGIYVGALLTWFWAWGSGKGRACRFPPFRVAAVLALLVGVMAADGLNSLVADMGYQPAYSPHNLLRLATGLGAGTAVAAYLLPVVSSVLWCSAPEEPILPSIRALLALLGLQAALWVIVALRVALFALPLALLTTLASLVLFGAINLLVIVVLRGWDNTFDTVRQIMQPGGAAVALALVEMAALALVIPRVMQGM